jgi:hypothetical protein
MKVGDIYTVLGFDAIVIVGIVGREADAQGLFHGWEICVNKRLGSFYSMTNAVQKIIDVVPLVPLAARVQPASGGPMASLVDCVLDPSPDAIPEAWETEGEL